jgi:hypothetical protein
MVKISAKSDKLNGETHNTTRQDKLQFCAEQDFSPNRCAKISSKISRLIKKIRREYITIHRPNIRELYQRPT